jgi:S1-C subfamily serine protease
MNVRFTRLFLCLLSMAVFLPRTLFAQQGGVDAVAISNKYYNSICKILLYDSATGKLNPDKAYLGRGSGFFVTDDGYIFTNKHVINMTYQGFARYQTYNEETKKYDDGVDVYNPSMLRDPNISKIISVARASIIVQVYTNAKGDSSKLYHAQIIALDTANFDGAILKINSDLNGKPVTDKFHVLPIGNSDSVKQGQDLCLFGFPAQYGGNMDVMLKDLSTLIFGKHSGYDYRYNTQFGFIKTDAVINNGNSGGPVFGPSNTVVGIATAAFEKTNVGLIGPIDAMYYTSALIPDLQRTLTANGFKEPSKKPAYSTSTLYKPAPLPNAKEIKHSNNMAGKKGLTANRGYAILSLVYGVSSTNTYSIGSHTDPTYTTAAGNYAVQSQEFGIDIRIVKPTFLKQTNNLIGYFVDINPTVYMAGWQSTGIIAPTSKASNAPTIQLDGTSFSNAEPNLYLAFGFSYTYLFVTNISISVYYGPGADIAPLNQITFGTVTAPGAGQKDMQYQRDIASFCQNAGLLFRYKAGFLGFNYRFGNNMNIQYQLPDMINNTSNTTNISGKCNRSLMTVTLGIDI